MAVLLNLAIHWELSAKPSLQCTVFAPFDVNNRLNSLEDRDDCWRLSAALRQRCRPESGRLTTLTQLPTPLTRSPTPVSVAIPHPLSLPITYTFLIYI